MFLILDVKVSSMDQIKYLKMEPKNKKAFFGIFLQNHDQLIIQLIS